MVNRGTTKIRVAGRAQSLSRPRTTDLSDWVLHKKYGGELVSKPSVLWKDYATPNIDIVEDAGISNFSLRCRNLDNQSKIRWGSGVGVKKDAKDIVGGKED